MGVCALHTLGPRDNRSTPTPTPTLTLPLEGEGTMTEGAAHPLTPRHPGEGRGPVWDVAKETGSRLSPG
ncbi:hypothetical protein SAMN02745223_01474 [Devosia limi DSM 17137]|uniref:Uncharacterized protein n=1 Tax=Devosia limi DSM 17137 TaxID=1121477 RepID=A0A1M4XJD1_9HYPH|nr:hypothetical protein SAMN02745223_01474 [Devosia limi DSM 17137]